MSREKLEPWPDTRAYTKGRGPRGLRDTCAGPASGQGDMSSGQLRALRCGWGHPVSPCGVIILPEGAASYLRLVGPCPHASGRPGPGMGPRGPDEASRRARPGLGSRRGPGLTSSTCAPGSGFLRAARSPRGLACGDCRIWLLSPCDCRGGVPTGGSPPRSDGLGVGVCQTQPGGCGGARGWYAPKFGGKSRVGAVARTERCPLRNINHQVTDLINFVPGGFFFFFSQRIRENKIFF